MIITKKAIPRRTVLRGVGVSLALPLLDAMVPALARAAAAPVRRLCVVYVPHGMSMGYYTPPTEGVLQLSPVLEPLAAFKERLLVISGLDSKPAEGQDGGVHPRCQTAWATGVKPIATEGANIRAGMSVDQIAAEALGSETQLGSLELALETTETGASCGVGYSCAYSSTIAWRSPTLPLPMEYNPRAVFERMFGASDTTDARSRLDLLQQDRSLLDLALGRLKRLSTRVGTSDRRKLEQYTDAVRDVERRIQKAEAQNGQELPVVDRPAGVPDTFGEHATMMYDLLALAYQTDLTRVATFLLGREQSVRTFPEISLSDPWHQLSHHNENTERLARLSKLNAFHFSLLAHFLERLRTMTDGDGSLLDSTLLLYGSGMSNSSEHAMYDVPTVVVAGDTFKIRGGRHIRTQKGTPLTNLQLALLERVGVPMSQYGDSNGSLEVLSI